MKNIILVVIILLVFIGGYFLFNSTNSVEEAPNLSQTIEGKWQSIEDKKSVKVFGVDGTTEDIYDGEVISSGTWEITDTSLKVNDGTEVLTYTILKVDKERLELSFLPRGNTLSYTKIQE